MSRRLAPSRVLQRNWNLCSRRDTWVCVLKFVLHLPEVPYDMTFPTADNKISKEEVDPPHGSVLHPPQSEASDFDSQIVGIIERAAQNPPPGVFGEGDLKWALQRRAPRGKHRRRHIVQHCYILTSRVDDFIAGMQGGKAGLQCVFRRGIEDRPRRDDDLKGIHAPKHFWRSVYVPLPGLIRVFTLCDGLTLKFLAPSAGTDVNMGQKITPIL